MLKITHVNDGFDFLGQNIRKYDGKLLIKPSKKNIKNFLDKIRALVNTNKTATQDNLIRLLNPVIRGWANYHQHVVSKKVFTNVNSKIWELIWNWAKRRHPNKSLSWTKGKYFKRINNRDWVFKTDSNQLIF